MVDSFQTGVDYTGRHDPGMRKNKKVEMGFFKKRSIIGGLGMMGVLPE